MSNQQHTPVTFDTLSEAQEFADKNGGTVKFGKHYGIGIYDYIVAPVGQEDEVLGHDEYQAIVERLCIDGKQVPTYEFAAEIVAATARHRAAIAKATIKPQPRSGVGQPDGVSKEVEDAAAGAFPIADPEIVFCKSNAEITGIREQDALVVERREGDFVWCRWYAQQGLPPARYHKDNLIYNAAFIEGRK